MNIVKKLTLRHLKENKGRTIITVFGICVSVAMITAVFVSVASFMRFYGEASVFETGKHHAEFYALNDEQLAKLKSDSRIETVGISAVQPPESDAFRIEERVSDKTGIGNIFAADEAALQQYLTSKMDGAMPKNENEIAIEQDLIEKNHLDWKIGDTISLTLGERTLEYNNYIVETDSFESEIRHVGSGFHLTGEMFTPYQEKVQFKITGILHMNKPTWSFGKIIRGMSPAEKKAEVNACITLKDANYKSLDVIKDICKNIGVTYDASDEMAINKDYLESKFAFSKDGLMVQSIIPMGMVILVIIMIASVVLIYNSFGMSLSERTRYLGMLGSVGATKKQKKQSVYFEGLVLGAVGIPLGIISGIIGIGVTLEVVGDKIVSTGMLMNIENSNVSFKATAPLWVIAGIVLFSIITIFISSVIPAKKASAITPVEALRQSTEFKIKAKKVKSPKYIRKIFGYEGELAHKNLKRNGRKSKVITASIAISVILFLSVNSFCSLFTQANGDMSKPYQIELSLKEEDAESVLNAVKEMDYVKEAYITDHNTYYIGENVEYNIENSLSDKDVITKTYSKIWKSDNIIQICYIEDEMFNNLCKAYNIDFNKYYTNSKDTVKMILLNDINRKKSGAGVFNDNAIGKMIPLGSDEEGNITSFYQVQDLVDFKSDIKEFEFVPQGYMAGFVPFSEYKKVHSAVYDYSIHTTICIETDRHEQAAESLENYCEENKINESNVYDLAGSIDSMNTIMFVLQVFIYGFITLITMITVANIINTISTSIALRRKEFAMLKSVGATQNGFYKMICLESLFYGLKALIFAIPISALISFGLNKLLALDAIPFEMDYLLYAYVILAVFLIVGFSMLYSVSKIKKDSIIETLKQDIT